MTDRNEQKIYVKDETKIILILNVTHLVFFFLFK